MKSITEQLVDVLRELQTAFPQIEASIIMSVDGLPMALSLPGGFDDGDPFFRQAELLSNAQNLIAQYPLGLFEYVCIQGQIGFNVLLPVNERCFFSMLVRRDSNIDEIVGQIRQFVFKIDVLVL